MGRLAHAWLDDSEWPLLRVKYPPEYTLEDNAAMFHAVEAFYAQNSEPFVWLVDTSGSKIADAKVRKLTSDHEVKVKDYMRRLNLGTAFVMDSALMRGVLTAIYWVAPPPYPYDVFRDEASARKWCYERIKGGLAGRSAKAG